MSHLTELIFVYGTLQRGQTDYFYWLAHAEEAICLGTARTVRRYPLFVGLAPEYPSCEVYFLDLPNTVAHAQHVCGELFLVSRKMKAWLDVFARVHTGVRRSTMIQVEVMDTVPSSLERLEELLPPPPPPRSTSACHDNNNINGYHASCEAKVNSTGAVYGDATLSSSDMLGEGRDDGHTPHAEDNVDNSATSSRVTQSHSTTCAQGMRTKEARGRSPCPRRRRVLYASVYVAVSNYPADWADENPVGCSTPMGTFSAAACLSRYGKRFAGAVPAHLRDSAYAHAMQSELESLPEAWWPPSTRACAASRCGHGHMNPCSDSRLTTSSSSSLAASVQSLDTPRGQKGTAHQRAQSHANGINDTPCARSSTVCATQRQQKQQQQRHYYHTAECSACQASSRANETTTRPMCDCIGAALVPHPMVLFIIDGIGDSTYRELGHRTPLEVVAGVPMTAQAAREAQDNTSSRPSSAVTMDNVPVLPTAWSIWATSSQSRLHWSNNTHDGAHSSECEGGTTSTSVRADAYDGAVGVEETGINCVTEHGVSGLMDPYMAGVACGSDTAHLAMFGYPPEVYYRGRGAFEALGAGLMLGDDDIAFKSNFATLDEYDAVLEGDAADRKDGTTTGRSAMGAAGGSYGVDETHPSCPCTARMVEAEEKNSFAHTDQTSEQQQQKQSKEEAAGRHQAVPNGSAGVPLSTSPLATHVCDENKSAAHAHSTADGIAEVRREMPVVAHRRCDRDFTREGPLLCADLNYTVVERDVCGVPFEHPFVIRLQYATEHRCAVSISAAPRAKNYDTPIDDGTITPPSPPCCCSSARHVHRQNDSRHGPNNHIRDTHSSCVHVVDTRDSCDHRGHAERKRTALVLSDKITGTDPLRDGRCLLDCRPTVPPEHDEYDAACLTSRVVNAASAKLSERLRRHAINTARRAHNAALRAGRPADAATALGDEEVETKNIANVILLRGAAKKGWMPSFLVRHGRHGVIVAPTCIIRGLGMCCGLSNRICARCESAGAEAEDATQAGLRCHRTERCPWLRGATGDVHSNVDVKVRAVLHALGCRSAGVTQKHIKNNCTSSALSSPASSPNSSHPPALADVPVSHIPDAPSRSASQSLRGGAAMYTFAVLHVKGVDDAGHDRSLEQKLSMLQRCGRALQQLWDELPCGSTVAVVADHSTPLACGDHCCEPVPVSVATKTTGNAGCAFRDGVRYYSEVHAQYGALGRFRGDALMDTMKRANAYYHYQ